mmetsp:Transcript_3883/g.7968  ORF Transcript_3883/g.7968 Transcript_3883/m.7968 type:complete len:81 (-) Transcript_3883:587-829(-)
MKLKGFSREGEQGQGQREGEEVGSYFGLGLASSEDTGHSQPDSFEDWQANFPEESPFAAAAEGAMEKPMPRADQEQHLQH